MYRLCILVALTVASAPAQSTAATKPAPSPDNATSSQPSAEAAEVLTFERAMEAAVVRGDVAYVDRVSAPDLSFTHGDGWTNGGKPLLVDNKASFLKRVENKQYNARARAGMVLRLVRARLRKSQRAVALRLPPHRPRPDLRARSSLRR